MSTPSLTGPTARPVRIQRVLQEIDYSDVPADWSSYAQLMKEYDEAMVRDWKEEVDTLLVFAGLFSAVVTAFNIEAYKFLQDDPSQTSVQVLQQISEQLAQLSLAQDRNTSSTVPPFQGVTSSSPSTQSVRINALWFSSLVCALFSALIGIMVKQWLREYMAAVSLSPREGVRLRQHRFGGLVVWHVPEIMAFLPILLELSLILFLVGLVDFLWLLQSTVAAIVTTLIALALLFYAATTVAPILSTRCPYKSPQSWVLVRLHRRAVSWIRQLKSKRLYAEERSTLASPPAPHLANWSERDNGDIRHHRDELELKAMTWVHSSFMDGDTQDSLISVIRELKSDSAGVLVFSVLAHRLHISTTTLINQVRSRSCQQLLRDAGSRFHKRTRTRTVTMFLELLQHVPRDHNPSKLGALDILWSIWEFCLGACVAEDQDPLLYQSVLNGMAELLSEGEPFRLCRAALNLLYESTHAWTYLYCPAAIGNIISFARACYRHHIPDMFLKASAVVLLLSPGLNWDDDDAMPFHRQQLQELLRDLGRFLRQCNEDGTKYEERSVGKLVYGLVELAEKDAELVETVLPDVLLEGVQLGLVDLSQEERLMLRAMQETRFVHSFVQRAAFQTHPRPPNGAAG